MINKDTCKIIEDLLPLYEEDLLSDSSQNFIKEHINSCSKCRKKISLMNKEINLPVYTNTHAFEKVLTRFKKEKLYTSLGFSLITSLILLIVFSLINSSRPKIIYESPIVNPLEDIMNYYHFSFYKFYILTGLMLVNTGDLYYKLKNKGFFHINILTSILIGFIFLTEVFFMGVLQDNNVKNIQVWSNKLLFLSLLCFLFFLIQLVCLGQEKKKRC